MNVGEYVRIKNDKGYTCIGKIYNINDYREPSMKYCIDIQASDFVFISEEEIIKSSPNIIDLIEVGDYVNGHKVFDDMRVDTDEYGNDFIEIGIEIDNMLNHYIREEEIKSIVTKEQFEQMEYKIND